MGFQQHLPTTTEKAYIKKQKNMLLNSVREMVSVVCAQLKKIVLASETKTVQRRKFRGDFFWQVFLEYS